MDKYNHNKPQTTTNVGKYEGGKESLSTVDGNINECSHCVNQCEVSSKKLIVELILGS
jgi:hypothetical protein